VVECGVVDSSDMPVLVCSINTCTVVIIVVFNYVCECTVGVDVGDGPTPKLMSILSGILMGCIVLRRQMNVDFATRVGQNTMLFVGMDVRFGTMQIHDSI
jgi:hypothetical protein